MKDFLKSYINIIYHRLLRITVNTTSINFTSNLSIPPHGLGNPLNGGLGELVHLLICHLISGQVLVGPRDIPALLKAGAVKQSPEPFGNVRELVDATQPGKS